MKEVGFPPSDGSQTASRHSPAPGVLVGARGGHTIPGARARCGGEATARMLCRVVQGEVQRKQCCWDSAWSCPST